MQNASMATQLPTPLRVEGTIFFLEEQNSPRRHSSQTSEHTYLWGSVETGLNIFMKRLVCVARTPKVNNLLYLNSVEKKHNRRNNNTHHLLATLVLV